MLDGKIAPEDHMLELDPAYPVFALRQYRLLQELKAAGKVIVQVEPFLEHLLEIQYFFAEGHSPADLDRETAKCAVYCCERDATGLLIEYYAAVKGNDFAKIIRSMKRFARADAIRFKLRDQLRADRIAGLLKKGFDVYVEAGSIHLALHRLLNSVWPAQRSMRIGFIERETMKSLGLTGNLFNPGDELTLSYVFEKNMSASRQDLLCAQSLIYAKLIRKEETQEGDIAFPHLVNDLETVKVVRKLSFAACRELFFIIREKGMEEAWEYVRRYPGQNCIAVD